MWFKFGLKVHKRVCHKSTVRQRLKRVRQRKETAQEVKQRKEFVKAKRAIYRLITSNPKVTTAQIADKLNVSTRQVQKIPQTIDRTKSDCERRK